MTSSMQTVDEIMEAVRRLPEVERRRLIDELQGDGSRQPDETSDNRRRAAMARWLARAGTGHSDFTDVSTNKNKHLAEISAGKY